MFLAVVMDWKEVSFLVAGGLGIFLFGIKFMGDGLKLFAGDKIKVIIEKTTSTPLKGVIVGIVVTGLIQSSSGTTALAVGLVRAGLMTLPQAIGIIMGANIGTTVTAFLIGLKIKAYALPIMAVGSFIYMFAKKHKTIYFGQALLGFGALFYGMGLMSSGLKPLSAMPWFTQFMLDLSDSPVLGAAVGLGLTLVVQSSSATIGILQSIYAEGVMELKAALPILFGSNIGTTVTAFLAALGGSAAAKRTSAFHIIFNIMGSVFFLLLLNPYNGVISWMSGTLGLDPKMQIALAHGVFNLMVTIMIFPFAGKITNVIKRFIKDDKSHALYLDDELLNEQLIDQAPALAIEQAKKAVAQLNILATKALSLSYDYFKTRDPKHKEESVEIEEIVDQLEVKIKSYLIKIAGEHLTDEDSNRQTILLQAIKDIERIADHSQNLNEFFDAIFSTGQDMQPESYTNIKRMFKMNIDIASSTTLLIETFDIEIAAKIRAKEDKIDIFQKQVNKEYIATIKQTQDVNVVATLFGDIINNLEKVGDHCDNIALYIIGEETHFELDLEEIDNLIAD